MTTKEFCAELKITGKQLRGLIAKSADTGYFDYGGRRWRPVKVRGVWSIDEIERPALSADRPDLQKMDLQELRRQKAIAEIESIRQKTEKERDRLRAEVLAEWKDAEREVLIPLRDWLAENVRDPEAVKRLREIVERILTK